MTVNFPRVQHNLYIFPITISRYLCTYSTDHNIIYRDSSILNFVCKNVFFVVGIDIEINFKPNDHKEHIKESMSEDSSIEESPSTIILPPRLSKVLL